MAKLKTKRVLVWCTGQAHYNDSKMLNKIVRCPECNRRLQLTELPPPFRCNDFGCCHLHIPKHKKYIKKV